MRWRDESGRASRPVRKGDRPTVGVLVDWLKDSYQNTVLAGLSEAAQSRDVNLVIFAGGVLGAPASDGAHRNFAFDLCGPRNVDAVVALAGALGNHLGPEAVRALLARWAPLPVVSVALGLPGVPSLLVDEAAGMRQALEHLVVRHGCRRIAFIRGPAVNAEAERRYALYRTVLGEHGLAQDPQLVCEGTFQKESGAAAIHALLDERKVDLDAVVASNDYMALAAIAALQERGVHVPSDVAVLGFDDLEDARFATPPLTTVRQPLYQQGEAALDLVLSQLEGRQVAAETLSATELVIRQSCGCFSGLARPGRAGVVTRTSTAIDSLLAEHADALRGQMTQAVHGAAAALEAGWDRQLLDAFEAELRGAGAGLFAATLDSLLAGVVAAGDDVAAWQGLVSALRKLLLPALANEALRWMQAEDLWHEARILICDLAERAQAQHRLRGERLARSLTESSATLLATQEVAPLLRAIAEQLPRFGIPAGWLALFGAGGGPAASARLVLAHDERAPAGDAGAGGVAPEFPAAELLPAEARPAGRRASLVVEPLFFGAEALGFVVLEMGPPEGIVYESLGEQVSAALEGARLVEKVVEEATRRQIAERQRLEKEMEIAARIQTSILPRDALVPGLEIAARMLPATEVGGDYYDVIPVEGGCWIGIGDVAGHGLPTGLVMLMMQSGLGALARKLADAPPRELLLALNAMLVDNVRARVGGNEHATLTLLRYRRDGRLAFAGAHEEILICRAATGRVERVATPGAWVGAKRDISEGTVDSAVQLHDGDVLVLYTDGVIEAASPARERFGIERLVADIERRRDAPVGALRDGIIETLTAFAPARDDDVTLLVARFSAEPRR
jgi:DNA-binding LacI/PurR family transcriptional regulator/serine phosphatase RsbU (regulator of sigma subunit)